jgi:cysteine-rich repeat protein
VWITGSASDTLIRFEPETERFTPFPAADARELHARDRVRPRQQRLDVHLERARGPDDPGRGKFVKVELPPRTRSAATATRGGRGVRRRRHDDCNGCSNRCTVVTGCGDGVVCGDEACDDGNDDDCDGCSAPCTLEPASAAATAI